MKKLLFTFNLLLALAVPVFAVDLTQTPASVLPSASAEFIGGSQVTAFETILQGQPVAIASSTAGVTTVRLADATSQYQVVGIAATGASAGQPITVIVRDPALSIGATVAAGDVVYLSPTAGKLTITYADLTAGKYVQVIGVGIGGNKINMGGTTGVGRNIGVLRADVPK